MIRILFGIFLALHGLVHLLYFGQSVRLFTLQPGMVWPDGSWAFSRLLGEATTRYLAGTLLILSAIGFAAGGVGIFAKQAWFRPIVAGAAVLSSTLFILFWDGSLQHLDNKGAIGILINLLVLAAVFLAKWPKLAF